MIDRRKFSSSRQVNCKTVAAALGQLRSFSASEAFMFANAEKMKPREVESNYQERLQAWLHSEDAETWRKARKALWADESESILFAAGDWAIFNCQSVNCQPVSHTFTVAVQWTQSAKNSSVAKRCQLLDLAFHSSKYHYIYIYVLFLVSIYIALDWSEKHCILILTTALNHCSLEVQGIVKCDLYACHIANPGCLPPSWLRCWTPWSDDFPMCVCFQSLSPTWCLLLDALAGWFCGSTLFCSCVSPLSKVFISWLCKEMQQHIMQKDPTKKNIWKINDRKWKHTHIAKLIMRPRHPRRDVAWKTQSRPLQTDVSKTPSKRHHAENKCK